MGSPHFRCNDLVTLSCGTFWVFRLYSGPMPPFPSTVRSSAACGLTEGTVRRISADKREPAWMLAHRIESLRLFRSMPLPVWGPDLSGLQLDRINYYAPTGIPEADRWEEVPVHIRRIYDRLGIPEAEHRWLAGAGAQYESDVIYHHLQEVWEEAGVIFLDMDDALHTHEDLVRAHFMTCVPNTDHKFSALHGAVWSGGTFLYVPPGVTVRDPLQAYFRMDSPGMGQFEHTLIIVGEGADVHYIEGCSAPKFGKQGLHAGCVEIFVKR